MPSSGLHGNCMHVVHTHAGKTPFMYKEMLANELNRIHLQLMCKKIIKNVPKKYKT